MVPRADPIFNGNDFESAMTLDDYFCLPVFESIPPNRRINTMLAL